MQAYVRLLEAEPGKHPVIIKSRIGISWHLEIIRAFSGAWRRRPYRSPDLHQIPLCLFWTFCYVFVNPTTFVFCHGCILGLFILPDTPGFVVLPFRTAPGKPPTAPNQSSIIHAALPLGKKFRSELE
jgi:hypothetical protein